MAFPNTNTDNYADNVNVAAEVFAEYGNFIRGVIRYHTNNDAQVDDLLQDFFLSLVYKPPPSGIENLRSYLYKAVINDIIDAVRRVERYQTQMHRYTEYFSHSVNKKYPEDAFIEIEEMNRMFRFIEERLPQSQAQVIALRYKNNCSIKEIAKKMSVNHRSVSRYISVGFKEIRRLLTVKKGD